jgi:hypothetical protein
MNNKIKIALAIVAGGSLILLNLRRRKRNLSKIYTAPDGNTYRENQIYRTFDHKLYKNGKQISLETPQVELKANTINAGGNHTADISKKLQTVNKEVNYHQKGNRHH